MGILEERKGSHYLQRGGLVFLRTEPATEGIVSSEYVCMICTLSCMMQVWKAIVDSKLGFDIRREFEGNCAIKIFLLIY